MSPDIAKKARAVSNGLCMGASAASFSALGYFSSVSSTNPVIIATIRNILFLILLPRSVIGLRCLSPPGLALLMGRGLCDAVGMISAYTAFKTAGLFMTSSILFTAPLIAVMVASVISDVRLTRRFALQVSCALLGAVLITYSAGGVETQDGALFAVLAAVLAGTSFALAAPAGRYMSVASINAGTAFFAALVTVGVVVLGDLPRLVDISAILSGLCAVAANMTMITVLARPGGFSAMPIYYIQAPISLLLDYLFLKNAIHSWQIAGSCLVIAACWVRKETDA